MEVYCCRWFGRFGVVLRFTITYSPGNSGGEQFDRL
jgi:hypothetical protein